MSSMIAACEGRGRADASAIRHARRRRALGGRLGSTRSAALPCRRRAQRDIERASSVNELCRVPAAIGVRAERDRSKGSADLLGRRASADAQQRARPRLAAAHRHNSRRRLSGRLLRARTPGLRPGRIPSQQAHPGPCPPGVHFHQRLTRGALGLRGGLLARAGAPARSVGSAKGLGLGRAAPPRSPEKTPAARRHDGEDTGEERGA